MVKLFDIYISTSVHIHVAHWIFQNVPFYLACSLFLFRRVVVDQTKMMKFIVDKTEPEDSVHSFT